VALTDEAILKIKAMILAGDLRPGERLPPEQELSEALGLSRSSLREAVKALELIRVLDVRRGDGTYVTSLQPQLLLDAMSFVVEMHQDSSVLEMFAVRRILESAAAGMAAVRATPADIAYLHGLLDDINVDTSVDDLVAHDLVFHRYINQLSGNAYLASLLDSLSSSTLRARVWRGLTEQRSVQRTLSEHASLVTALAAGDAQLATAHSTIHVSGVSQWLERTLG
jgi:GntR family transcriptional regulator, transcriptional repressor for pyruvate dehydrogenase complex